jgi:hypothetical protein
LAVFSPKTLKNKDQNNGQSGKKESLFSPIANTKLGVSCNAELAILKWVGIKWFEVPPHKKTLP